MENTNKNSKKELKIDSELILERTNYLRLQVIENLIKQTNSNVNQMRDNIQLLELLNNINTYNNYRGESKTILL